MTKELQVLETQSGVSLLELLTVFSIISVLALSSYPALSEYSSSSSIKRETKKVQRFFLEAQTRALSTGKETTLTFADNNRTLIMSEGARTLKLSRYISYAPNHSSANAIKFRANGTSSPGTVALKDNEENLCAIIISLRGRIRSIC